MSEVEKATEPVSVEIKDDDAKSDIEDHEIAEVDKNGDSAAPAVAPVDETEAEKKNRACRQIEFYFADSNLPYDRFMWTLHTANAEHWVPIKTVASFKRMREFSELGDDWVVSALKESQELEMNEECTNVRRKTEVKEPKGAFERSIYAKGFGKDVPGLQLKLEKFFNTFGRFNAVRMRRDRNSKEFKGSVFVEFADVSSAERFLNADPKPTWEGTELLTMSKEAYCDMKIKEKGLTGKAAEFKRQNETTSTYRGFNAFRPEVPRKEKDSKDAGKGKAPKPDVFLDFMGKKLKVIDKDGGHIDEAEVPYVKGTALKISGIEGNLVFDEIKTPLKERFEHAPFIKYEKEANDGLVGFSKALTEEDIDFVKEKVKTLNGKEVSWAPAEEAEEKAFLIERAQNAARRVILVADRGSSKGGRGGSGGRGGARGGGGRGGGRGGRGGRGGGRGGSKGGDRRDNKGSPAKAAASTGDKPSEVNGDSSVGEKRKRGVEPSGGPDAGIRGATVPVIQSSKKAKTDETPAS